MLVGLVVAPSADEALEARRLAARLERVGKQVQMRWAEVQRRDAEDVEEGVGAG
jgi:hypothetical protein